MTATQAQIQLRPGDRRGRTNYRWLHSRHSFSFGHYYDPENINYRSLRVINDDVVAPGGGFPQHPHENMEIITWVLEGGVAHKDSTGAGGVIRPGDLQMMTAGRGIEHSEMNASTTEPVHLLQIWIEPDERDLQPSYRQQHFVQEARKNRWQILVSPDQRDGSMRIHQDAVLSVAEISEGASVGFSLQADRHGYVHVAYGEVAIGELRLKAGDAVTITGPASLKIEARAASQVLWFDLA